MLNRFVRAREESGSALLRDSPAYAKTRLRCILGIFFVCLLIPLGQLVRIVWEQTEREGLVQLQADAADLVIGINAVMQELLDVEYRRPFADYSFIKISQNKLVQQAGVSFSPLAELPPKSKIPGIIGYFQISPDGRIDSPVLPEFAEDKSQVELFGWSEKEFNERIKHRELLKRVLQKNLMSKQIGDDAYGENFIKRRLALLSLSIAERYLLSPAYAQPMSPGPSPIERNPGDKTADGTPLSKELLREKSDAAAVVPLSARKLSEININQQLWMQEGQNVARDRGKQQNDSMLLERQNRVEQVVIPEQRQQLENLQELHNRTNVLPTEGKRSTGQQTALDAPVDARDSDTAARRQGMSLLAFESEIWPLEFQLLEGGYFVFYRKVFRQNARFLQGFVCEAEELLKAVVGKAFAYSRVSSIGSLVIGHNGEVYSRFITRPATSSGAAAAPEEKLYYKDFLAPPLDSLELVFAAREIPLGTGARLVDFLILCLSVVILVGLWGIYRLGIGQIEFARQRSNFVSAVSHELKTPLTSIRMYAEMLRANWLVDEEKRKSYYDFIFFESERLSRLISNVLHFSKLTNTAEPLENKELDVCGLVLAIRQKVASQVESAGFALEVKCADEGELRQHKIIGDEDSLARIFINLVDNAIKFSGNAERKLIELGVALEESEKKVIFSVRDYGPGVPAEQVSRIFDLFYRGQDEMTRTTSGTGIGLALVRELANKHGAKVRIINRTPGAEFQVEFPVVGRFGEAPDTVKKN